MKIRRALMNRNIVVSWIVMLFLGVVYMVSGQAVSTVFSAPTRATVEPADIISIKGTCDFRGTKSTWSATLTARSDSTYDAVYVSSWGGNPLNYVGIIKTDFKTEISGNGTASGGSANGSFEFSGKYGNDGIARCSYREVGGRGRSRSGTLTAEMPK